MDPDQTNAPGALDWSRSIRIWIKRLRVRREWVGFGSTRPRRVYKRVSTRFHSFPKTFSLSSLLLSAVLSSPYETLTLNLAQNRAKACLIFSPYDPKHWNHANAFKQTRINVNPAICSFTVLIQSFFNLLRLKLCESLRIHHDSHSPWIFDVSCIFSFFRVS